MIKLGIDIDDTITNTSELLLKYVDLYGQDIDFNNPLNSKIDILRGKFATPEVREFVKNYSGEILEKASSKENVASTITKLRELGVEINIITTRSDSAMPNATKITQKFLASEKIEYDNLFMGIYDKKQFCEEHEINYLIDDSIEICKDLLPTSTMPFLFTSIINKDIDAGPIKRVNSWDEIWQVMQARVMERNDKGVEK